MCEALFYTRQSNNSVRCELCPWFCELKPGMTGNCKVRKNENGKLVTDVFNKVAAMAIDPIEKKPLYHFHPGKNILSIGEVGCNLHCSFCQNHNISQCSADDFDGFRKITSDQLVKTAARIENNIGIAYTYNEPFTFYEFMLETARKAKERGLKNVVISNGYVNPEPLKNLIPFVDAFNIDLKAFTEIFYKNQTKGKLAPVLETLKIIAKSRSHLEITNLVIPGLNDGETDFEKMVQWIAGELGEDVPLHLSRYFPKYKLGIPATSIEKLNLLYIIAKKHLHHVYLGNTNDYERSATYCRQCGIAQVLREGYKTKILYIDKNGLCTKCGATSNIISV